MQTLIVGGTGMIGGYIALTIREAGHEARPELVEATGYVRSRLDADEGIRALADDRFHAVSLTPAFSSRVRSRDHGTYLRDDVRLDEEVREFEPERR